LKRIGIALFGTRLAVRSKAGGLLRLASLGAQPPALFATIKAIFSSAESFIQLFSAFTSLS
jgi:hypothetical protein